MDDRRVHAECDNFAVVRYERAGKWYVEPRVPSHKPLTQRIPAAQHIGVADAALRALSAETLGGIIYAGTPGGRTFDSWVGKLREKHNL